MVRLTISRLSSVLIRGFISGLISGLITGAMGLFTGSGLISGLIQWAYSGLYGASQFVCSKKNTTFKYS